MTAKQHGAWMLEKCQKEQRKICNGGATWYKHDTTRSVQIWWFGTFRHCHDAGYVKWDGKLLIRGQHEVGFGVLRVARKEGRGVMITEWIHNVCRWLYERGVENGKIWSGRWLVNRTSYERAVFSEPVWTIDLVTFLAFRFLFKMRCEVHFVSKPLLIIAVILSFG